MNIIPTVYNGHTFRSLMEAQWAVFFDYFGFRWNYEPKGFEHDAERYLPDFYIRDFDLYVEVKHTDGEETERAKRFARNGGFNLVICDGNPHCRPLVLIAGRPGFDLPVDGTKILWYYKPGEGLLYEATAPSERSEYKRAVARAVDTKFNTVSVLKMLGQARRDECAKLNSMLKDMISKYNIPKEEMDAAVEAFKELNATSCLRAYTEACNKRFDNFAPADRGLLDNFDFNKGWKS